MDHVMHNNVHRLPQIVFYYNLQLMLGKGLVVVDERVSMLGSTQIVFSLN